MEVVTMVKTVGRALEVRCAPADQWVVRVAHVEVPHQAVAAADRSIEPTIEDHPQAVVAVLLVEVMLVEAADKPLQATATTTVVRTHQ